MQVAQPAGVVDELAEQQGAAVAEPGGVAAELVAGVGLRDRRRALGEMGAGQQPDAVAAEPVRVEAELGGQRLVEGEHPGLRGLGGLPGQGQLGQLAGEAAVEDEGGCRGHSLDDTRRAGTIRPPVSRRRQAPPAGSASSMMSGLSRAVTWARHWSTNRARRVPSLRSRTSTPRLPARAAAPVGVGAPGDLVVEAREADRRVELVGHPVLDDLELHRADGGEDRVLVAAQVGAQHLHHALLVELLDAASELLVAADVAGAGGDEVLGREARDGRVLDGVPDVDGVADPQGLRVDEADDVAGLGALDGGGVATEDRLRELRREGPAAAGVGDDHAALEGPRHDPGVGEPVAVGVVHPRLHLEDERAEVVGRLAHRAVDALGRAGVRGDVEQQVEQLRDAEVLQGRGEHDGRGLAGQEALLVVVGLVEGEQLVLLERRVPLEGVVVLDLVRAHPPLGCAGRATGGAGVLHELAGTPVQHAAEVAGLAHRPGEGSGPELDLLLDQVHQLERRQPGPVPLVDDRQDRDAAQRAHLEELEGLRLEALSGVDQHHGGVDG